MYWTVPVPSVRHPSNELISSTSPGVVDRRCLVLLLYLITNAGLAGRLPLPLFLTLISALPCSLVFLCIQGTIPVSGELYLPMILSLANAQWLTCLCLCCLADTDYPANTPTN